MIDIKKFEEKLKGEKQLLENELSQVAQRNPSNPSDWVPAVGNTDQSTADDNVTADSFEALENNMGVTTQLENRLGDINMALEKIGKGTFGVCEVCGGQIEDERLEANPAAKTCKVHMS